MSRTLARAIRLALLLLPLARGAGAQHFDSTSAEVVAPGVTHRRLVDNAGPWQVNVLEVKLHTPSLRIESLRANDRYAGRERVTDMVRRHANDPGRIVAAVNGDLFSLATGATENSTVVDGTVVKGARLTDTGYDAFDNAHSQFAIAMSGKPLIERLAFDGRLSGATVDAAIVAVNFQPPDEPNALVLYDWWVGARTPAGDSLAPHEIALHATRARGDTIWFRADTLVGGAGAAVPPRGYVLAGYGNWAGAVDGLRGRELRTVLGFRPNRGPLRTLVGGWGRLVTDGHGVADSVNAWEGTPSSFSVTRHPRTGVGFSRDSSTLYLVTVDGRSESSSGMSLLEFARLFTSLGAYQAMNLDGGGSSTMVVGGKLVNRPSDAGGERKVGDAIVVYVSRSVGR